MLTIEIGSVEHELIVQEHFVAIHQLVQRDAVDNMIKESSWAGFYRRRDQLMHVHSNLSRFVLNPNLAGNGARIIRKETDMQHGVRDLF